MFSGIIEAKARAKSTAKNRGVMEVAIETPKGWKLAKGQSIAVDGICSTVVKAGAASFSVEYMPETVSKTTAGDFAPGRELNLERSLRLNQLVDGSLTLGHVDARVKVSGVEKNGGAHLLSVAVPKALLRYVALHGSIVLNGVSLTVARLRGNRATVALIPYTLAHTNLGTAEKGDEINLEIDLIARYVARRRRVLQ